MCGEMYIYVYVAVSYLESHSLPSIKINIKGKSTDGRILTTYKSHDVGVY